MGEVFDALLGGKVLKNHYYQSNKNYGLIKMIDGELYTLKEDDLTCKYKWGEGSFILNESESYSVYVKEEISPRTYTRKEAAELLIQGKKIKGKTNPINFYYYLDSKGYVATSYGSRIYNNLSDFLYSVHSASIWVEHIESEEDEFSDYVEYT